MDIKDLIDNIDFILYKHETCVSEIYRKETIELTLTDARRLVDFAKSMQWQPIETAPKDGTEIMLMYPDGSMTIASWGYTDNDSGFMENDDGFIINWCTHWMPKPQLPKDEK